MSEIESVKLCRSCGKKNFIFCDVKHEVIKKLRKIVDGLFDIQDTTLPSGVCINCYQMIKRIVFDIEGMIDMQKILKIQCGDVHVMSPEKVSNQHQNDKKRSLSLVEDIEKKYTSIKLRKISPPDKVPEKLLGKPAPTLVKADPIIKTPTKVVSTIKTPVKGEPKTPTKTEQTVKSPVKTYQTKKAEVVVAKPSEETAKPKRYMCTACGNTFPQVPGLLQSHLKTCNKGTLMKCFCGPNMMTHKDLMAHISTVHKEHTIKHICKVTNCKKQFETAENLQKHMQNTHKLVQAIKKIYGCNLCSAKFATTDEFKDHRNNCKNKPNEA